ncbi:MAG: hypothetical protein AAF725_14820 [Acidobacteriota bacterium]
MAASLLAPLAIADEEAPASGEPQAAAAEDSLTPFQVRHGDLVENSRRMALDRSGPLLREVPEPSSKFRKNEWREKFGTRTVPTNRAWEPDQRPQKGAAPGLGLSLDFGIESIDLSDASGITGFLGTPPDTMGAVGPTQFFTAQNTAYRVHDKLTGAADPSLDVADGDFWVAAVDPDDNGGGDPRVRYDRINDRWVIIAFDLGPSGNLANNRILLAVSDGPTLSTSTVWTQFFFTPLDTNGGASESGCFADYPMLGVDRNAIYIGANMFNVSSPNGGCGGGTGTSTAVFVTPLNQLPIGGGNVSNITTAFTGLLGSVPIWSPMPADNVDPAATTGYIIGHDAASDTNLKLGKISNPGGAAGTPTLTWTDITISDKNDGYGTGVPYPGVPAPTGTIPDWGLATLGFRPLGGAHVVDGRLWTAMTSSVDGPDGTLELFPDTGDRHSVVYFEIDVATDALIQDGNVFDQETALNDDPTHVWMGSIGVNGQGHAVVGATGANTTTVAPSAMWAGRLATDPQGRFSNPDVYLAGTNTGNARHSFETTNRATRWGDYAQVTVDPCDDMTFYAIAQYQDTPAVSTGGNWATAIARVLAPPPTFGAASAPAINDGQASVTLTVTGEGFYQTPTTGMPACRTQLEITSDIANLGVNGVTFVSSTEIVIDFDTTSASGPGTVTITNPDGQSTSFDTRVGSGIFEDDFESGGTGLWSSTSP